jgi:hypothetical protein
VDSHDRLHWRVLGAAIGLALVVVGVIGVLLAIGNSKPKPPPTSGLGTNAAQSAKGSGLGHLPGFGGGGGGTDGSVQTKTLSLTPAQGWAVVHKDNFSVFLSDPAKKGLLGLESGTLGGSPTTVSYAQSLANAIAKGSTNAKICGKVQAAQIPNGPRGLLVPICYTLVPQNGRAIQLYQIILAAVAGKVGVAVRLITPANGATLKAFVGESGPVVTTVHWKLLT